MRDEYECLRKRIEDGLEALDELQRRLEASERVARERKDEPKLRLIKGGLVGAGIWAGVEWLRNYRRAVAALAVSGLTMGGVFIMEQPNSPGSDPPEAINPPASITPSVKPPTPTVKPRPPRTSPLRTLARNSTPVAAPKASKPSHTSKPTPTPSATPTVIPSITPSETLTEALPSLPVETPALATESCAINLLGIKVCLPLG